MSPSTTSSRTDSFVKLPIVETRMLTDDAMAVRFALSNDVAPLFRFEHGQYLTLSDVVDGEPLRRSYSICSAVGDADLTIAVKRIDGASSLNTCIETSSVVHRWRLRRRLVNSRRRCGRSWRAATCASLPEAASRQFSRSFERCLRANRAAGSPCCTAIAARPR